MNSKTASSFATTMNSFKDTIECEELLSSSTINILMLISFIIGFFFFRNFRGVNKKLDSDNILFREERNPNSDSKIKEEEDKLEEKIIQEEIENKFDKTQRKDETLLNKLKI